jgi:4-hydroxy-tetrahydrodipicolinate synthase
MQQDDLFRRLTGIFPAVPTALTPDEELDVPGQQRLVEYLIESGVDGLWMLGSSAETPLLADHVRLEAVRVAVQASAGRVPVIAGAGESGTQRAIERIRELEEIRIDCLHVTAPYYFLCTPADLLLHFKTILDATDLPVMIYDIPVFTRNPIGLQVIQKLAEYDQVVGIKDSAMDFKYSLELLQFCQSPRFRVFLGWEELLATSVSLGADGAVLGAGSFAPRLARSIFEAARADDRDRAMGLQTQLNGLLSLLGEGGQITDASFLGGVKFALACKSICAPTLAKPLSPISPAQAQKIQAAIAEGLV